MILRTLAALYSLLSDGRPPADDLTALARANAIADAEYRELCEGGRDA